MPKTKYKQKSPDEYQVLRGTCPDDQCHAQLYFPQAETSVECTNCGQRHAKSAIRNIEEVKNAEVALHNLLKNVLLGNIKPQKGPENVKVLGLSNYECKLVSSILTTYGMDKSTGKAKLLTDMGQQNVFDCGLLGDRAFQIDVEHLDVIGYGRDRSGSLTYLADILNVIKEINDGEDRLIPIHADGDGHCLVHAISRALVGRELFWHALRVNLQQHFQQNVDTYKQLFKDFVDVDEWSEIIDECDPNFEPRANESMGLRNIHIFGLANVLKRPIILLDSVSGMQSSGDYSGVFLPVLVEPEKCRGKDGMMSKPLCIAWSSSFRHHFIPLVSIKGRKLPRLPRYIIKRAWGISDSNIDKYIDFDTDGMCDVGGEKCLQDRYLQRLVKCMEEIFLQKYSVHPSLVADVHQYIFRSAGMASVPVEIVIETTQRTVDKKLLYRCLTCDALTEYNLTIDMFIKGGSLYELALKSHGPLATDKRYSFPMQGIICSYNAEEDCLVPDMEKSQLTKCAFCQGDRVRHVLGDGNILYKNGDRTLTTSNSTHCTCGFKHYWDGKEYDNMPKILPVNLEWSSKVIKEKVPWFENESDITLNSNVYEVAQALVQKHFPGEFGSERLVQKVVDTILRQTALPEQPKSDEQPIPVDSPWSPNSPSKIIITGQQRKSVHKEELNKSKTEKAIKQKIETNAPLQQKKKTSEILQSTSKSVSNTNTTTTSSDLKPDLSSNKKSTPSSTITSLSPIIQPDKKIKLVCSNGKQATLTLKGEITFEQLQKLILETVNIPPDKQKIRLGFPPKELKAPTERETGLVVPLLHGDKISLDIIPDKKLSTLRSVSHSEIKPVKTSWSSFDDAATVHNADRLLDSLRDSTQGSDSIDTSIASLSVLASLSGKDLWTYVQTMPHLFSVGGLFYQQVDRDLGLTDGKHCTLPALPGKVFRFNTHDNRLELCLEPYGHFPVEPNIEKKVTSAQTVTPAHSDVRFGSSSTSAQTVTPAHSDVRFGSSSTSAQTVTPAHSDVRFGSSGAVAHKDSHVAFSGHGHSLISPVDMTESLRTSSSSAKNIQNLCTPLKPVDAIEEEVEGNADDSNEKTNENYNRMGPGFSVLQPDLPSAEYQNNNFELFQKMAAMLEQSVADDVLLEDVETSNFLSDLLNPPVSTADLSVMTSESKEDVTMETDNTKTPETTETMETE